MRSTCRPAKAKAGRRLRPSLVCSKLFLGPVMDGVGLPIGSVHNVDRLLLEVFPILQQQNIQGA